MSQPFRQAILSFTRQGVEVLAKFALGTESVSAILDDGPARLDAYAECLQRASFDPTANLSGVLREAPELPGAVAAAIHRSLEEGPLWLGIRADRTLAAYPWEAFRLGDSFLAIEPGIEIMRLSGGSSGLSQPVKRILIAFSDPQTPQFPALLGGEKEADAVYRALRSPECRSFLFDRIDHTTLWSLHRHFSVAAADVFHFIGHGEARPTGGVLILEGSRPGEADPVAADELARLLLQAGARIAILSGCQTAAGSLGVAQGLLDSGLEAVVAMQQPISDEGAYLFSRALYGGLLHGTPLLTAVAEARRAIRGSGVDCLAPTLLGSSFDCGATRWVQPTDARTETIERGNLPHASTSFVGRESEIEGVARQLLRHRLVTLHGSGGIGKTRLSIEAARRVGSRFRNGVWQILLDEIMEPDRVTEAIAKPFGIVESDAQSLQERLYEFLTDQELLLLLDNCEHVLEGCQAAVSKILARAPHVSILATSRFVLDLSGEAVVPVPSLGFPDLPEDGGLDFGAAEALARYESIALFVQRGQSVDAAFELTEENLEPIARIAKRLDGIPLAIELAAARLRSLDPEQIWRRLSESFDLLNIPRSGVVERQTTVRAAIDWSYRLLTEDDRLALHRLSIIAGSFDLPMAEAVLAAPPLDLRSAYEHVARLVDRSFLIVEQKLGEKRFRMLDMTRAFAAEGLAASGEEVACHERLLRHLAQFASHWIGRMQSGNQQLRTQAEMAANHGAIIAEIEWALENGNDVETVGSLVRDTFTYWFFLGDWVRGERMLKRVLARLPGETTPLLIQIMTLAGSAAVYAGRFEGIALVEVAYELAKTSPNLPLNFARSWLFGCAYLTGDDGRTLELAREQHDLARERNLKQLEGYTRLFLGHIALGRGDLAKARAEYGELLTSKDALGDVRGIALACGQLGHLDFVEGKATSRENFHRALSLLWEANDLHYMGHYAALGSELFVTTDPSRAAQLQGWAAKIRESGQTKPDRHVEDWIRDVVDATRQRLGEAYADHARQGATLSDREVVLAFESSSEP